MMNTAAIKTLDRANKTISVTKDFLMKAGKFGTPEFAQAMELRWNAVELYKKAMAQAKEKTEAAKENADTVAQEVAANNANNITEMKVAV